VANTRIRYNRSNEGLLVSGRALYAGNDDYVLVKLDTENFRFEIVNAVEGTIISEGGNTKNLAVLKKQAKRALKAIGVEFDEETRNKNHKLTIA